MSQEGAEPSLEDLPTSYADAFVEPLLDKRTGTQFIKLMAREMVDGDQIVVSGGHPRVSIS